MIGAIEKYNITADNIYNWDEKGYLIGQASATKRIMSCEALDSGRIKYASQDGNREFISLLACIRATGTAIPPTLIYKGDSNTLQDTWLEDYGCTIPAHFGISPNGWSCDAIGRNWLTSVFDRYTQNGIRTRRLLIVDGHSSHVNIEFINLCDSLRIIILILPPHSTHRLQPLDVSLFAPLARYYTNGLNELMFNSLGMTSISKRIFWSVFWPAWQAAFSENNILSGFRKTGIWPYNPDITLSKITKPLPIPILDDIQSVKTPITCRAIRRTQRLYYNAPSSILLRKIFKSNEQLASQHSINTHVIQGLTTTLKNERKRRYRGKRLNLTGEESSGPQLYSPSRIAKARELQSQKEADEVQKQQKIADKKALAATKKLQKETDKALKAIAVLQRRKAVADAKAQKAQDKQAQAEAKKAYTTPKKKQSNHIRASIAPSIVARRSYKASNVRESNVAVAVAKEPLLATSRGRRVHRPQRFEI